MSIGVRTGWPAAATASSAPATTTRKPRRRASKARTLALVDMENDELVGSPLRPSSVTTATASAAGELDKHIAVGYPEPPAT